MWVRGRVRVGRRSVSVVVRDPKAQVRSGVYVVELAVPMGPYAKSALTKALQYGDVARTIARRRDVATVTFVATVKTDGGRVVIDVPQHAALDLAGHGINIRGTTAFVRILGVISGKIPYLKRHD